MMLATSSRISQWTVQKLSHTGQSVLEAVPNHIVPLPAWTFATRRFQHSLPYHYQQGQGQGQGQLSKFLNAEKHTKNVPCFSQNQIARWRQNFARLYARRILEIAAASAASQRLVAEMESKSVQNRPTNWQDWERKDWTDELLSSIGNNSVERLWSAVTRVATLTTLAAPMCILVPCSYVSDTAHKLSWRYALWGIEQAGPTFLKLVQWATTRQDLFSPQFCQYFGKLRDDTVGHAWKDTEQILEEDLGAAAVAMLNLRPDPIGSGCIAQVYRGTLKEASGQYPAGTAVAVKVQHPGIWHKVCVDFYILGKTAKFLEDLPYLNLGYLALADSVRQFRDMMLPQLDLTLEAKHLQRFNRDFSNDETISFPHPLHGLTTPRVLTETYVDGTPIMEYLTAPKEVRKELALMGLNATLKMIFLNDFLHGDLHPGNILVGEIPGKPGKLQLHLLDCGLVVEMGPQQHVNLTKILGAFTRKRGRMAGQLMVDTSSKVQASDLDMELFIAGIAQIVEDDKENNFLEKVGDYITDICFLACRHKVKLEASFINAALAVEIMEGIATALSPDLIVTKVALPLVVQAEMMHRLPKFSLW